MNPGTLNLAGKVFRAVFPLIEREHCVRAAEWIVLAVSGMRDLEMSPEEILEACTWPYRTNQHTLGVPKPDPDAFPEPLRTRMSKFLVQCMNTFVDDHVSGKKKLAWATKIVLMAEGLGSDGHRLPRDRLAGPEHRLALPSAPCLVHGHPLYAAPGVSRLRLIPCPECAREMGIDAVSCTATAPPTLPSSVRWHLEHCSGQEHNPPSTWSALCWVRD